MTRLCEIGLRYDQAIGNLDHVLPEIAADNPAIAVDQLLKDTIKKLHTDKIIGLYHPFGDDWYMQCPAIYFGQKYCDADGFVRAHTKESYVVSQTVIALGDVMRPLKKAVVFEEIAPGKWAVIET